MSTLGIERSTFDSLLAAYLAQFTIPVTPGPILATRVAIINAVKAKIDELIPEGEGVAITFSSEAQPNVSNPYDIFINVVMDEVTKELLLMAPIHIIVPKVATPSPVQILSDDWGKTGYMALPSDFLRLSSVQLLEWERPVTVPITPVDPAYDRQKNKYARGGVAKPVVVLTWYGVTKVLEYYSVVTAHTLGHFRYVPETLPEDLQDNMVDALTWLIAEKVLQITSQLDLAKLAYEKCIKCFENQQ
jgi:hypothetical protein